MSGYGYLNKAYDLRNPSTTYDGMTIGHVVDTNDPQQMGRVRAICPLLGDKDTDLIGDIPWATYASPFGGMDEVSSRGRESDLTKGPVAYGMWNIPKIGSYVLISCIDGDSRFRVWMGCLNPQFLTHTMPHGRYTYKEEDAPKGPLSSTEEPIQPLFDAQTNAFSVSMDTVGAQPPENPRETFEYRTRAADYGVSAIDDDIVSSDESSISQVSDEINFKSVQEADGNTFTYTQGYARSRLLPDLQFENTKDNLNYDSLTYSWTTPGFHSISMDDRPENCRIRLRTTHGHQLILDDTNERLTISVPGGDTYLELDEKGNIDIYAKRNVSVHAEKDINITTNQTFRVNAEKGIHLETPEDIRLHAGKDVAVRATENIRMHSLKESFYESDETTHMWSHKELRLRSDEDTHFDVLKSLYSYVEEETHIISNKMINILTCADMYITVLSEQGTGNFKLNAINLIDISSKELRTSVVGGDIHMDIGGSVFQHIDGDAELHVDGTLSQYIEGDMHLDCDGVLIQHTEGDIHLSNGGSLFEYVENDYSLIVGVNFDHEVGINYDLEDDPEFGGNYALSVLGQLNATSVRETRMWSEDMRVNNLAFVPTPAITTNPNDTPIRPVEPGEFTPFDVPTMSLLSDPANETQAYWTDRIPEHEPWPRVMTNAEITDNDRYTEYFAHELVRTRICPVPDEQTADAPPGLDNTHTNAAEFKYNDPSVGRIERSEDLGRNSNWHR